MRCSHTTHNDPAMESTYAEIERVYNMLQDALVASNGTTAVGYVALGTLLLSAIEYHKLPGCVALRTELEDLIGRFTIAMARHRGAKL